MVYLRVVKAFLVAGWEVLMEIQAYHSVVAVAAVVVEGKAYYSIAGVGLQGDLQVVDMVVGIAVDIYDPIVLPVP